MHRDPSKRWRECVRIVPENQKNTEFLALPLGMPIDYYDPDFFNSLQPQLRSCIATTKVALLPDATQSFACVPDERLSDKRFVEKHAGSILAKYHLADKGELDDAAEEEDFTWSHTF